MVCQVFSPHNPLIATHTRCPELLTLYRPEASGHFVQFYEHYERVVENVAYVASKALGSGGSSVLVAAESHLRAIEDRIAEYGSDLSGFRDAGRLVALGAEETLSRFLVDGRPVAARFNDVVGGVIRGAAKNSSNGFVFAFGEMVALLCAVGEAAAAVALEKFWNSLATTHRFSLFCAYPLGSLDNETDPDALSKICAEHSLIIPAESLLSSS
ncbi:MAG: MEDS domain-containing protein [Candidatus Binataceae bacterium]